jgi:hypothetical protein
MTRRATARRWRACCRASRLDRLVEARVCHQAIVGRAAVIGEGDTVLRTSAGTIQKKAPRGAGQGTKVRHTLLHRRSARRLLRVITHPARPQAQFYARESMNRRAGGRHKGRATCVFSSQCRLTWPRSGAGLFCRPACSSTPTKLRQCVSVSASHIQPGWRHCYQTEAGRDLVARWHVEAARRVADCARVASSYLARRHPLPGLSSPVP